MADESDDHPNEEKRPFRDLAKRIEEARRLPALSASGVLMLSSLAGLCGW